MANNKKIEENLEDFYIKITPGENFDENFKKFFDKTSKDKNFFNKIYRKDEAGEILRIVQNLDNQIKENSINKGEFSKSTLEIEMQLSNGEAVNFTAPLGRNVFKSGKINDAIKISSKIADTPQISEENEKFLEDLLAKDKNDKYKTKLNPKALGNMFNNGLEGLAKMSESIGDENVNAFVKGFASSYGFAKSNDENLFVKTKEKKQEQKNKTTKDKKDQSNEITKDEKKAIKNQLSEVVTKQVKNQTTKEKEISKPTSIGKSI